MKVKLVLALQSTSRLTHTITNKDDLSDRWRKKCSRFSSVRGSYFINKKTESNRRIERGGEGKPLMIIAENTHIGKIKIDIFHGSPF